MAAPSSTVKPRSRGQLLAMLSGVALVAVALLVGFVLAIHSAVTGASVADTTEATTVAPLPADQSQRRDTLAAAPMLKVSQQDATQGIPAATPGPGIEVPTPATIGPAKVTSGFPHTPEGAVAQLAAIEVAVLSEMSIARTAEIHQAWTADGAVPVEQWRMTRHVQAFLGAANMGQVKDPNARVMISPVAAQVKATDGPNWVIACVLTDVRAVIKTEARMAHGYCERMAWDGTRWLVAPGEPPAEAPSTWPGTELAFQAGWRTWAPVEQ